MLESVKQSGFAPILIVLILATAALGGYFYFQKSQASPTTPTSPIHACSPDSKVCSDGSHVGRIPPNCDFAPCPSPKESTNSADISNWKTYTDTSYGFSIKYPSTWQQRLDRTEYDDSDYHLFFTSGDYIEIRILPNPNKLSSLDYFKKVAFRNDLPGWNNTQRPTQTVNLPNIDVIKINGFTGGSGDRGPTTFISKDTIIIEIITQSNTQSGAAIFNQILSTFKFIE